MTDLFSVSEVVSRNVKRLLAGGVPLSQRDEWMSEWETLTTEQLVDTRQDTSLSVCLSMSSSHGHESPREPSFVLEVQTIEAIISVWSLAIPHPIKFPRFRQYNVQLSCGCDFWQVIKIGLK